MESHGTLRSKQSRGEANFVRLVHKATAAQQEGINGPALHRRLDAACRQLEGIGDLGQVREDLARLKMEIGRIGRLERQLEEVQSKLTYHEGIAASLNARLAKLESENKVMQERLERLHSVMLTPGKLAEEQQLAVRQNNSTKAN